MNNAATTIRLLPRDTVLIADEHALVRDALKMIARRVLGTVDFLEAHDAESLLATLNLHSDIRLALVDLKMPGMHGGRRLRHIVWHHPRLPLVVVSEMTSLSILRRIVAMPSVHAFVPKSSSADAVRAAIEAALHGKRIPATLSSCAPTPRGDGSTSRQEEIRKLLWEGLSYNAIASTLGISTGTVKNHITEIFKHLNTEPTVPL